MKHCGTQELTTERLVLRRMTTDDCEMMFGNWANAPEVTRYLRWEPHRDWVVTMAYLNEIVKQYDRPDFYDWGICDKVTGVLMGNISIAPAESCEREKPYAWKNVKTELLGGMYEIGYSLGKKVVEPGLCHRSRRCRARLLVWHGWRALAGRVPRQPECGKQPRVGQDRLPL